MSVCVACACVLTCVRACLGEGVGAGVGVGLCAVYTMFCQQCRPSHLVSNSQ